ncbi:unnamed protein product [Adineta ricciae]|uniref:LITAF domain-containing protein n=1 Tax=Adineta ricciae TaxID=249248 RepID=A0A815GGV8_ADIRI|nr:unnamed protein product [Adineta ricciae]
MANATYPTDPMHPPPYTAQDELKASGGYQQQMPPQPPIQPTYFAAPPPPAVPMYAPATVFQPIMGTALLGRTPVAVQCPRCQQQIVTVVQYETGGGTWLIALLICIFGGIFGCCLIPFCVPDCQDAVHTCPACRSLVGRRNVI